MNKTVCFAAFALLIVGFSLQAAEQATTTAPQGVISKFCSKCPIKSTIVKAFNWCKSHPVYLAAGVTAAALVTVVLTVPAVKEKIRDFLGLDSHKKIADFDSGFVCQEEIEQQRSEPVELDPLIAVK